MVLKVRTTAKAATCANLGFKSKFWAAAEYQHVVFGLISLKYISHAFEAKHNEVDVQFAHGDTFHSDRPPDLKTDYVLANPPFYEGDWRKKLLKDDKQWVYGTSPSGNTNYAWN